jgi:hypothetical protein
MAERRDERRDPCGRRDVVHLQQRLGVKRALAPGSARLRLLREEEGGEKKVGMRCVPCPHGAFREGGNRSPKKGGTPARKCRPSSCGTHSIAAPSPSGRKGAISLQSALGLVCKRQADAELRFSPWQGPILSTRGPAWHRRMAPCCSV